MSRARDRADGVDLSAYSTTSSIASNYASKANPVFTGYAKITPQSSAPVSASGNAGAIWIDSDDNFLRYSDGTRYRALGLNLIESDGTRTTHGSYQVYTFLSSGYFTVFYDVTVAVLLISGGGGGGGNDGDYSGGGGGAGAFYTNASMSLTPGKYTVTVGAGGAGGSTGTIGGDTIFNSVTANGGGPGARAGNTPVSYSGNGSAGADNTGNGGAGNGSGAGKAGGSGIVVIRLAA